MASTRLKSAGSILALIAVLLVGPGLDLIHSYIHASRSALSDEPLERKDQNGRTRDLLSGTSGVLAPACPLCTLVSGSSIADHHVSAALRPSEEKSIKAPDAVEVAHFSRTAHSIISRAPPSIS